MKKFFAFLKKELREMLPPTLFFLAAFELFAFSRALMDERFGVSAYTTAAAAVGALIVGKSILIADALPVWHLLDRCAKIYLILARTCVYALIALAFQVLEEGIPLARSAGSLRAGVDALFAEIYWPRLWATHSILVAFLVLYNVISVTAEALGEGRFKRLMLQRPTASEDAH